MDTEYLEIMHWGGNVWHVRRCSQSNPSGRLFAETRSEDDARRIVAALKLTDDLNLESLESGKFAMGEVLDSTEPAMGVNAELVTALEKCAKELGFNDPNDLAFESDFAGEVRTALANARNAMAVTR